MDDMYRLRSFTPNHVTAIVLLSTSFSNLLKNHSNLTATQYRVLLKTNELDGNGRIGEIAKTLKLKSSAVSQAVNQLENNGLVQRVRSIKDKRVTILHATQAGKDIIVHIDNEVVKLFREDFGASTDGDLSSIFQSFYLVGGGIEGSITLEPIHRVSSSLITTITSIKPFLSSLAYSAAGISLTDFRVMQVVCYSTEGVRVADIATTLVLPANTITWTIDRLQESGLVLRKDNELDQRSVQIIPTLGGIEATQRVQSEFDEFLERDIWPNMTDEQMKHTYIGADSLIKIAVEKNLYSQV